MKAKQMLSEIANTSLEEDKVGTEEFIPKKLVIKAMNRFAEEVARESYDEGYARKTHEIECMLPDYLVNENVVIPFEKEAFIINLDLQ